MKELRSYIAISSGMALATSCFAAMAFLFTFLAKEIVPYVVLSAGVVCFFMALVFGELSSRFPSGPGIGLYIKKAFGEKVSLLALFLYMGLIFFMAGVESSVFARLLQLLLPDWSLGVHVLLAHLLLVMVMVLNCIGLDVSRSVQNFTTFVLIGATVLLSMAGLLLPVLPVSPASPPQLGLWDGSFMENFSPAGFFQGIGVAIFLFVGFEWVTPLGKTPQAYRMQLPLSMPLAIVILAFMYFLFSLALGARLDSSQISGTMLPQLSMARMLFPQFGGPLIGLICALAIFTSFNAGMLGGARMLYALSREGLLPPQLGALSRKGTPIGAYMALGSLSTLFSLLINYFQVQALATYMGAAIECLIYSLVSFVLFSLKGGRNKGHANWPAEGIFHSRLPMWVLPVLGIFFAFLGFMVLIGDSSGTFFLGMPAPLVLFLGLLILAFAGTKWSLRNRDRRKSMKKARNGEFLQMKVGERSPSSSSSSSSFS